MTLALPSRRLAPAWVRNDLWRRARAVPSLDLRFADRKSLVDAISGQNLITFTRASSGTYVGSDGLLKTATSNEPRFDHNPTTGESLGLLVEEQRTNLLLRSEEFDNASWIKSAEITITADSTLAPNGTQTADTVSLSSGAHALRQIIGVVAGTTYTFSFYVRRGTATDLKYSVYDNSAAANIIAPTSYYSATSASSWTRISVSFTAPAGCTSVIVYPTRDSGTSGTLFIWGAQLEAGAFPTSYIPTTGSAVTRNADVTDIINTAIANGIRTLYAEFRSPASGTRGVVSLNDNTANGRAAINTSGTDPRLVVVDGGVTQADIDAGTIAANTSSRMAVRINTNDFSASFNGGAVVTDTSGTLPTVDRLFIGRSQAGEYLNAPIARLIGWREALPDSVLQELTR